MGTAPGPAGEAAPAPGEGVRAVLAAEEAQARSLTDDSHRTTLTVVTCLSEVFAAGTHPSGSLTTAWNSGQPVSTSTIRRANGRSTVISTGGS
jgi:hypothetical protein